MIGVQGDLKLVGNPGIPGFLALGRSEMNRHARPRLLYGGLDQAGVGAGQHRILRGLAIRRTAPDQFHGIVLEPVEHDIGISGDSGNKAETFRERQAEVGALAHAFHGVDRVPPGVDGLMRVADENQPGRTSLHLIEKQLQGDRVGVLGLIEQEDVIILDRRLLQRPQLEVAIVADGQFLVLGIAHPIPDLPRHPEDKIPDGHRRSHGNLKMTRTELLVLRMKVGVQGIDRVNRQVRGRQTEQFHNRARPQLPNPCVLPSDGPPGQRMNRAAFTILRKTPSSLLGVVPVEAEIQEPVSGPRLGDQFQRGRLS